MHEFNEGVTSFTKEEYEAKLAECSAEMLSIMLHESNGILRMFRVIIGMKKLPDLEEFKHMHDQLINSMVLLIEALRGRGVSVEYPDGSDAIGADGEVRTTTYQ